MRTNADVVLDFVQAAVRPETSDLDATLMFRIFEMPPSGLEDWAARASSEALAQIKQVVVASLENRRATQLCSAVASQILTTMPPGGATWTELEGVRIHWAVALGVSIKQGVAAVPPGVPCELGLVCRASRVLLASC